MGGPKKRGKKLVRRVVVLLACVLAMLYVIVLLASPTDLSDGEALVQPFDIVESLGGTYFGPLVDNDYSGEGEFQHLSGGRYEGKFEESKREGKGTFTWDNGDVYVGTWCDDSMQEGKYTFSDGRTYEGTFSNGGFDTGRYSWQETPQDVAVASISAEVKSGQIANVDATYKDGTQYSGSITGKATILYSTGNEYEGEVDKGKRSGTGTFRWKDGDVVIAYYSGSWIGDAMSGSGQYHYSGDDYPYIDGSFVDGRPDGVAHYYKEAGNSFSTTWADGYCVDVVEE